MKKRIIAGLLVLVLLFSAVPVSALAAQPEEQATVDTGDVSIVGTNSFGTLLSQEIAESEADASEEAVSYEAGYTVTDLVIEGTTATVTYDSMEEALLVVALYTEDGMRMVTSATATVTADATEATVEFTGNMPEYFLASAYLVDTYDLSPLCAAYDTPMYTREMQELLASTVEDYDADRVMNLDDDNTTNFAVYAETTKVIEAAEGVNTVASIDDETATYVIKNADKQITSLVAGDVFVYPYAENEILIVKVATIAVDGTTVTITGDALEMEEVFGYLKIESTGDSSDMSVDESTCGDGVTYLGRKGTDQAVPCLDGSLSDETGFEFGIDTDILPENEDSFDDMDITTKVNIKGTLKVAVKIEFEFYITKEYKYVSLMTTYSVGVNLEFTGTVSIIFEELPEFDFRPIPQVFIGFSPNLVCSVSAAVKASFTTEGTAGWVWQNGDMNAIRSKPTYKCEVYFEGTIFIGLDLNPFIRLFAEDIAEMDVTLLIGVELVGKQVVAGTDGYLDSSPGLASTYPDSKHLCQSCLDINVCAKLELAVKIDILGGTAVSFNLLNIKLGEKKMYLSVDYGDYGLGTCPHLMYKVTVLAINQKGEKIPGANITVGADQGTTNDMGVAVFYEKPREYTVNASYNGMHDSTTVEVEDQATLCCVYMPRNYPQPAINYISGNVDEQEITDNSVIEEVEFNNNRYQLFDISMTWTEARAYCERIGGHLVTITSREEQSIIESLLASGNRLEYWIGTYYSNSSRSYVWVTGEAFTFSNWASGQPDLYGGSENYGQIFAQYVGGRHSFPAYTWNDIMDSNDPGNNDPYFNQSTIGFICEFESNAEKDPENEVGTSEPAEISPAKSEEGSAAVNAVYPGDYSTEVTSTYILKTASFTELVSGEQYVLLAMKSIDTEDPLASDNLLFIDQGVALEDGTLSFQYVQREKTDISYVVVCGASNKDLNDAEITFPEMLSNGELQAVNPTVIYDGVPLLEGQDYIIAGTVDYTRGGTYTCYIRGIHNYTGLVECVYTVAGAEVANGWSGYTEWVLTDDGVISFSGEGAMKNYTTKDGMPWYGYFDQITSVVLEAGVTSIGDYAFYGMPNLESITIPETVTAIGSYAFKNATKLDGVVLPDGLTKLGESAFYGCTSLTSIDIPASLWTVQPYSFKNCTALAEVTFHEGNLQKIADGAFYNTALTEVILPDCLTILDVYVFKNCADLASVKLSASLTQIREASLYGTAISTIEIPEGVTSIKPYAFKNCVNLVSVSLPSTLTAVEEAAFYACTKLASIDLPNAVTKIGNYAFRKCTGLTSVNFGSGLTNIGESSFYGCTGLTALEIPENVTTIQAYAFKGCTAVTSVSLPDSLVTLGDSTFHTCTGLKTIVIPANVETIGEYCFSGSYNLWKLTFQGDAPVIGAGAFKSMVATAYYPGDNATWTSSVMQNYGGSITWTAQ